MNKMLRAITVASLLLASNAFAAYDGTITLTDDTSLFSYSNGGEFAAAATPTAGKPALGNFQTFCIEYNEEFTPVNWGGPSYYYKINSGAVSGDLNLGHGSAVVANFDPISLGTAWLYSQFRAGNLAGYDYSPGSGRSATAGQLQQAIWYFEDEIGHSGEPAFNPAGNSFYLAAIAKFGSDGAFSNANGAYGVVALNLYTMSGGSAQDQLGIVVPEPATVIAGLLLLLPLGASTVRILQRKRVMAQK